MKTNKSQNEKYFHCRTLPIMQRKVLKDVFVVS